MKRPGPDFRLMGIVNVTPDSFSDGGRYLDPQRAIEHALALDRDGAAILDIGGESTRPGAEPVSMQEELRRVLPVLEALASQTSGVQLSIDTAKAQVARAALDLGFHVSFSGILTFKKAEDLRAVAAFVPLDRCLIETDSPYLAPVPLRGKKCEPANVVHTARRVAELRGIPVEEVAMATLANTERRFGKRFARGE